MTDPSNWTDPDPSTDPMPTPDPIPEPDCRETADDCAGETICIAERCEAAFPRFYSATIVDGELPVSNLEGEPWDADGSAPDPYVEIWVDGVLVGETSTRQDTWFPDWGEVFDVQLYAGSSIEFRMYDADLVSDDLSMNCAADPITPDLLRGRAIACSNEMEPRRVSVYMEPK